jgi:hypothetical protein
MSFTIKHSAARSRFTEVQVFLNFIQGHETKSTSSPDTLEIKTARGLFYVHLYSAWEKTINETVELSLASISSTNLPYNHFIVPFGSISLNNLIKSLAGTSKNTLKKSNEIFTKLISKDACTVNETSLATSNLWLKQLNEIRIAFGMKTISRDLSILTTLDEIVEKRNAVAHGRENASAVGSTLKAATLQTKLDIVSTLAYEQLSEFEDYITNKKYIKPHYKKLYST